MERPSGGPPPYTRGVTAADAQVYLNPFEPGFFDDPYAQYRRLRELAPVNKSPLGPWTLTRYEDVSRLLRDPSLVGGRPERHVRPASRRSSRSCATRGVGSGVALPS